jgi:tetratricopeptide (TPR) repeat protein
MLAIKNPCRALSVVCIALGILFFAGCTASGPRALLDGDRALADGKLPRAIDKLKRATELLPEEPRAWNLLGLAYHRSSQPQLAANAYRRALQLDRSNIVTTVTHFNLGCLLLEHGDAAGAANELRSFTMVTNSPVGLVKLGEAQYRLGRLTDAERSFALALKAEPKNAAAYNGLGLVYAQRKSPREAAPYVHAALQLDASYAPALLNSAVLAQQNPVTRGAALQRYKQYLAMQPRPANWDAVNAVARQLEADLAPKVAPQTNLVAQLLRTNAVVAAATNPPPKTNVLVAAATNPPPRVVATNAPPAVTAAPTNRPSVPLTKAPVMASAPPIATNVPVTMVAITTAPPVKTAVASLTTNSPAAARTAPPLVTTPPPAIGSDPRENRREKPGFFNRLNPFRKQPDRVTALETSRVDVAAAPTTNTFPAATPPKAYERYRYSNPAAPQAGNRANAEKAFQQGQKALRAGNRPEALLNFQLAANADPAFFDAQYNVALVTQESGDAARALPLWERALAVEPDSINARYNFALALKQAEFPIDAAAELERVLEAKPADARAHLTLGNLYAQQLNDNARARQHYLKVIELDPRNAQASLIRYWLAAHP